MIVRPDFVFWFVTQAQTGVAQPLSQQSSQLLGTSGLENSDIHAKRLTSHNRSGQLTNQSGLGFLRGGLKEASAKTEIF